MQQPPEDKRPEPTGSDFNDVLVSKDGKKRIVAILAAAKPFPPLEKEWPNLVSTTKADGKISQKNKKRGATRKQKRVPQRDSLLKLVGERDVELWHDLNGDGFATLPAKGHLENWSIRAGRQFRRWLSLIYLEDTGGTLGGQAMEDALRVLEGRAVHYGAQHITWRRVGRKGAALYLDLCDSAWRCVEITGDGWNVITNPPVKFLRTPSMRPIPIPQRGDCIERVGAFLNFATEDDLILVTAWLVASLRVGVPFPILVISGEQGSGKSVAAKLFRSLIDPNDAPVRAAPRDDRDLIVAAVNTHVLAFDNLSGVAAWFADGLSRIATGSGYSTRKLHTDSEEMVFSASKPCILNGIPALIDRADLADRAIAIHLPTLPETSRQTEAEIWREFDSALPGILGGLLDAVSCALRRLPDVKLERRPRMADFATWIVAAEPGLGWEPGTFLQAYERNRQGVFEEAAEADPIVLLIRDKFERLRECRNAPEPDVWEGRPTDLLNDLNSIVDEGVRKLRSWPTTPAGLGTRMKRAAPTLRRCGFVVDSRRSACRTIRIVRSKR